MGMVPLRDSLREILYSPDAPRIAEAVIKTFDGIYFKKCSELNCNKTLRSPKGVLDMGCQTNARHFLPIPLWRLQTIPYPPLRSPSEQLPKPGTSVCGRESPEFSFLLSYIEAADTINRDETRFSTDE
ncbi:hypothetical protein TNCV_4581101 [Trichonephila clavipes]|nr:hypothetical protein TNCV_4581101 [Trichonephila clavipes]